MDDGHDLDSGGRAIPRNEWLQVGSAQHSGESNGNVLGESGHCSRSGRDSASGDAYLEPDLCFGPARLRTRVRKPKAESDRPPLVLWQCRHRRRGQSSKSTSRVTELAQVPRSTTSARFPLSPRLVSTRYTSMLASSEPTGRWKKCTRSAWNPLPTCPRIDGSSSSGAPKVPNPLVRPLREPQLQGARE